MAQTSSGDSCQARHGSVFGIYREDSGETCIREQDTTAGNTDQGRVKSFCLLGISTLKQPALLGEFLSKYGYVICTVDRHMTWFELQITESRFVMLMHKMVVASSGSF
jgi:hypothetical protein